LANEMESAEDKNHNLLFERVKLEYEEALRTDADLVRRISLARNEIHEKIVEKWKKQEIEEIEKNFKKYIPIIEQTFKGKVEQEVVPEIIKPNISNVDGSGK